MDKVIETEVVCSAPDQHDQAAFRFYLAAGPAAICWRATGGLGYIGLTGNYSFQLQVSREEQLLSSIIILLLLTTSFIFSLVESNAKKFNFSHESK